MESGLKDLGNGVFLFPSQSDKNQEEYYVDTNEGTCDCMDWQCRRAKAWSKGQECDCKHLRLAKKILTLAEEKVKKEQQERGT